MNDVVFLIFALVLMWVITVIIAAMVLDGYRFATRPGAYRRRFKVFPPAIFSRAGRELAK